MAGGTELPTIGVELVPGSSSTGTVTSVSVVTANGFAGSVATPTTTPAITLSTTVTGILQGNGTAISAASTTGSGAIVLANTPTLITPVIGAATGTSLALGAGSAITSTGPGGTLTSLGFTAPGTGVVTALGVNVGSAGAFVTFNGAGGTPSSLVGTNITGTAAGLTAGSVTTNANLTGPIASVGNATSITSQTGTGTTFAMSAGPTFTGVVGNAAGSVSAPSLSVGNATTGLYSVSTTGFGLSVNGTVRADYGITVGSFWTFNSAVAFNNNNLSNIFSISVNGAISSATTGSFVLNQAAASATVPTISPNKADTTTGIGAQASGNISLISGGAEITRVVSGGLTIISGKALTLGNAATTGLTAGVLAALTNATIVITDSTGQAYRIPCII